MILDNCRELCLVEMRPIKTVDRYGEVKYLIAIEYIGEALPGPNRMNWSITLLRDARMEMMSLLRGRTATEYSRLFLNGEGDIYTGLYYLSEFTKKNNIKLTGAFKLDTKEDIQILAETLLNDSLTIEEYDLLGKRMNVILSNCGVMTPVAVLQDKGDPVKHPYVWGRLSREEELLIKDLTFEELGGSTIASLYGNELKDRERKHNVMEDGYRIRMEKNGNETYLSGFVKGVGPNDSAVYTNREEEMALTYRMEDVALMDIQALYDLGYEVDLLELEKVSDVTPDTIPIGSRESSILSLSLKSTRGV